MNEDAPRHLALSDLTAADLDSEFSVQVQVVGCKDMKAVPGEVSLESETGDIINLPMKDNLGILIAYLTGQDKLAFHRIRQHEPDGDEHYRIVVGGMVDFSVLFVRDLVDGERFTSRKATVREVYLIGQTVPAGNKLKLTGRAALNPKTKDITFVAFVAEPLTSQFEAFVPTEQQKSDFVFNFREGRDAHHQIAPHIVGEKRERAKLWASLVHHSVYEIPNIYGKLIRGCLRIVNIGDSRTGKSDIAVEGTDEPRASFTEAFGEKVSVETSSRTGILYTIDAERDVLKWGALPLNDRGYVALDGLQKMLSDEMAEYREAQATERIKVDRSQRGEAPMRVRQIACLNPHKPMAAYLFPCQAIADSNPFADPVDVTRWDMFIPFAKEDVDYERIVGSGGQGKPMDDAVYHAHVLWAWSRGPEDIIYREEARETIKVHASKLFRKYSITSLPLVHNEIREVLTRVSVAFACLRHSTDEAHERVIVTSAHVLEAYELMAAGYDDLAMGKFKEFQAGSVSLTDSEFVDMMILFGENHFGVLEQIRSGMKNSWELSERLGVHTSTIKRAYGDLNAFGLIAGSSRGIRLTDKGQSLVNRLLTEGVKVLRKETVVPQDLKVLLDVKGRIEVALGNGDSIPLDQAIEAIKERFDNNSSWSLDYLVHKCASEDLPFVLKEDRLFVKPHDPDLNRWM